MARKETVTNIILALLVYLPTCAYVPLYIYLVLIGFAVYLNISFLSDYFKNLFQLKIIDRPFTFLLGISLFAFILRLVDYSNWESIKDIYSFAYLFPFTYVVARTFSLRKPIFKYIIYFIIVEAIVGLVEYLMGVSTFFSGLGTYREFDSYNLLYFTRVFGLSGTSSILSLKFVIGIILLSVVSFNKTKQILIEIIFLGASIIAFGRIALIALLVYYGLKLFDSIFIKKDFKGLTFIPFALILITFSVNPMWTKSQFTRNNMAVNMDRFNDELDSMDGSSIDDDISYTEGLGLGNVDMSGRNAIWNGFLEFGFDNLFFGNKGKKYYYHGHHGHNSYLEVFTSFGIIFFGAFLLIFAFNLSKVNYVYALTILFLALGQYVIFWGISFIDVLFYYIVFFLKPRNEGG